MPLSARCLLKQNFPASCSYNRYLFIINVTSPPLNLRKRGRSTYRYSPFLRQRILRSSKYPQRMFSIENLHLGPLRETSKLRGHRRREEYGCGVPIQITHLQPKWYRAKSSQYLPRTGDAWITVIQGKATIHKLGDSSQPNMSD